MAQISETLQKTDKYDQVVLTGCLNSPINKADRKSQAVVSSLEEECLDVTNKQSLITYIYHNGHSAIDLILRKKGRD